MKFTKPALTLMALLGTIYMTPAAFAGETNTNTGVNTTTTTGNDSYITTPAGHEVPDPGTPATRSQSGVDSTTTTTTGNDSYTTTPAGKVVPNPGTPATRAQTPTSGGNTNQERSDTSKAGEMKSKSMKNCDITKDRNCDPNLNPNQTR